MFLNLNLSCDMMNRQLFGTSRKPHGISNFAPKLIKLLINGVERKATKKDIFTQIYIKKI